MPSYFHTVTITHHGYRLMLARNKLGNYLLNHLPSEVTAKVSNKITQIDRRIGTFVLS